MYCAHCNGKSLLIHSEVQKEPQYNTMQCNAMHCNALQRNATQRNAMQCNAIQYNTIVKTTALSLQCNYLSQKEILL